MKSKIILELDKVFKSMEDKYYLNGRLIKSKVINDLDQFDEELIQQLLRSELIRKHYTLKIADHLVLNINKLIETLEMNTFWKDSFTKYVNKIGLSTNDTFLDENAEVVLNFPYKDTVLKAGMTKEDLKKDDLKPDEPYLNEVIEAEEIDQLLDKKILVNAKKYTTDGISDISYFSEKDNLILKGNNLLALHTIKEKYSGKIRLIYIDPPYNTGNDSFNYNDNFNHSSWLTFMKNRLEIARELLTDDGVIFVQCDDNEVAYLTVLMDEIFGLSNRINPLVWKGRGGRQDSKFIARVHEYILTYAKSIDNVKINRKKVKDETQYPYKDGKGSFKTQLVRKWGSNDRREDRPNLFYAVEFEGVSVLPIKSDGSEGCWRWSKEKLKNAIENNMIIKETKKDGRIELYEKIYKTNNFKETTYTSLIDGSFSGESKRQLDDMFGVAPFKYAKPESLIKIIIDMATNPGDIVLDFFMGSATSQAVAHKMNRQYIGIEQMDYIKTVSVPRLQKVIEGEQGGVSKEVDWQGGGSFIYGELMEKSRGYIDQVLNAEDSDQLHDIYSSMKENVDLEFKVDLEEVNFMINDSTVALDDKKRMLTKIIDKNQLYYNYSEIDDQNVRDLISDSDYQFNQSFYQSKGDTDE